MDTKKQQMDIMHSLCVRELTALELNMKRYVEESERIKKLLSDRNIAMDNVDQVIGHHGVNMFALMSFDRYMTHLTTVIGMARKFNIHLQLNSLDKTVMVDASDAFDPSSNMGVIGGPSHVSQTRMIQDFIQWSNGSMGTNYDQEKLSCQAVECSGAIEAVDNTEEKLLPNDSIPLAPLKFTDIESILYSILPEKDLSEFTEGYTFAASVTFVEDYSKLVFFICEMSDYRKLYEISHTTDVIPKDQSSINDTVFGISQKDDSVQGERCVWRAIKLPKVQDVMQYYAVLIDFGEIIELTKDCQLYSIPKIYRNHYPMTIKCELKGVCDTNGNVINNHSKCIEALNQNEFKIAKFRVVKKDSRVLHLLLLNEDKSTVLSNSSESNERIICRSNPFKDSYILKDNCESEEDENSLCVPYSAVYSNKSPMVETNFPHKINIGDKLQVDVTHVHSPISFYAVLHNDNPENDINYFWQSDELSSQQISIKYPKINDIILAQYSKDEHWYRAKVIETLSDDELMFKVFYIDFGNTETVTINEIAACTSEMINRPPQAIPFRIADLQLVSEEKRDKKKFEEAKESIAFIVIDQTIDVEVIDRQGDDWVVHFSFEELKSIPSMLINMGVAEIF